MRVIPLNDLGLCWKHFHAPNSAMVVDIPTLLLMISVASMVMAVALMAVAWGGRRDGLEWWATALCVNALAYVLLALRGPLPDGLSMVLGNVSASATLSFLLAAVLRFQGRALHWRALLAPPLALAVLLAPLLADFAARIVLAHSVMALQMAWVLWALYAHRHTTRGRGVVMTMIGVAGATVALLVRAVSGLLTTPEVQGLLQPGIVQAATFMVFFAVLLIASLGFIFMSKERADETNLRLAAQDELTGVANRRSIIAALDRDVGRAIRTREPMAVMMVDIDHFKHVNDAHGHLAGDQVLRHVVEVIRRRIRAQDIVGRYGGEEFLVLLCDTTAQGAQQLAEHLREAVQDSSCAWDGQPLSVTVSVGVFGGRLEPGESWDQLIHAADNALYRAKQGGRNRVEVATSLGRLVRHEHVNGSPETFPSSLH